MGYREVKKIHPENSRLLPLCWHGYGVKYSHSNSKIEEPAPKPIEYANLSRVPESPSHVESIES